MNWRFIGACAWHGVSQAMLTGGTAIAVLQAWPSKLQWLILAAGAGVGFVKGVNGYLTEAKT